jgi:purine-binding chemotaxis protein CheW
MSKKIAHKIVRNKQYLTFMVGKDEYGIEILSVQEIHCWTEPRPMPDSPHWVVGIIDWREQVVPIIDLRIRFKYKPITYDKTTVVIILQSTLEQHTDVIGIVVDAVAEVYDISSKQLKNAPEIGSKVDTEYIKGVTKIKNSMIIVLNTIELIKMKQSTKMIV